MINIFIINTRIRIIFNI